MPNQEKHLTDESVKNEGAGTQATGGKAEIHDRTGLFVSIAAFGAALFAMGLGVGAIVISQVESSHMARDKMDREHDVNSKLQISENHWRDIEVKQKISDDQIQRLKEELSHDNRRR